LSPALLWELDDAVRRIAKHYRQFQTGERFADFLLRRLSLLRAERLGNPQKRSKIAVRRPEDDASSTAGPPQRRRPEEQYVPSAAGQLAFGAQTQSVGPGSAFAPHGIAIVNSIREAAPEFRWLRPTAGVYSGGSVNRRAEMDQLLELLRRPEQPVVLVGMPGIGKSSVARRLAADCTEREFPGGVLVRSIGERFGMDADIARVFDEWAAYGFGGVSGERCRFTASAVRAILTKGCTRAGGPLFVVLDDANHTEQVWPLLDALPTTASILITTRHHDIARDLHVQPYELGVMKPAEGIELLRAGLGDRPLEDADMPWVSKLLESTGCHPMALELATAMLARRSASDWASAAEEIASSLAEGATLGPYRLSDGELHNQLDKLIYNSLQTIEEDDRQLYFYLGAMAPGASFDTPGAAAPASRSSSAA
jgi:hypothetical protein